MSYIIKMHYCFIANEDVCFDDYIEYEWEEDEGWMFDWGWEWGRYSEWLLLKDWTRNFMAKKKEIDIQWTHAPFYFVDDEWNTHEEPFYFEWMADAVDKEWNHRYTVEEVKKAQENYTAFENEFREWLNSQPDDMTITVYDWHM